MQNNFSVWKRTLLLIAIIILSFSIVKLASIYSDYRRIDNEYRNIAKKYISHGVTKPIKSNSNTRNVKNPIDFIGLKKQNPDTVGWIQIEGLGINYPIMQSDNNEYYLNHTFEKTNHFAGSIFINHKNSQDFTDTNTILFGHNMKNGSMFGLLKNYRFQETYEQNPIIWIYTPINIRKYQVISCREVTANSNVYQTHFKDQTDFSDYLDDLSKDSLLKNINIPSFKKNSMITLSTCTSNDNYRLVVQAIQVETINCE